ncbi:MAG: hypothetical protein ACQEW5_21655 [Bacillota bacterium]
MASEFNDDYEYVAAEKVDIKDLAPLDAETSRVMKQEFATGFKLTIFYYIFIFSIPILNWYMPEIFFSKFFGGMTYSWFFTSVIAMALAFIIAYVHTSLYEKRLKKYEDKNAGSTERRNIN